uniref:Uncharacterized protein n=1 Tax=Coccidioides posadasii RMSCC 3488 TaxID=454284 RepID=A0A0J6F2Y4_COCPO|nr:hypothetical protein CPAG_03596 [Coccidioides posadasii RMSCC 3488]
MWIGDVARQYDSFDAWRNGPWLKPNPGCWMAPGEPANRRCVPPCCGALRLPIGRSHGAFQPAADQLGKVRNSAHDAGTGEHQRATPVEGGVATIPLAKQRE